MTVGRIWQKTTELPGKGWDFAKNNPWTTGGIGAALVFASALAIYYSKCPNSKCAELINNVAGVTSNFVKANPTIILAAFLTIAIIAIGILAYKNNDKANRIEEAGKLLNGSNPGSQIDQIKLALGLEQAPVSTPGGRSS